MTLADFEALVLTQQPAVVSWEPVTDYSFEARKAIEGEHPQRIKDTFQPKRVLDAGCGRGAVLVELLRAIGVNAHGFDPTIPRSVIDEPRAYVYTGRLGSFRVYEKYDLVICREVFEHLTVRDIYRAVRNLRALSTQYVYVTTRFHPNPASLLDVATSDGLDPTHISLLNQDFLRVLFVLEGFKRRADLERQMDWQQKGRVLVYERAA